jgi:DNA-binding NtrC family response regulator
VSVVSALLGSSTVIRHVQHLIMKVAEAEAPVLITGEPGTGKEMVARAIHEKSSRASGPFVPVKCGTIAEDLLEAELFGHEKGAFPGANQSREGRFAIAEGGTIFLEEVSKLSARLQMALMRLLTDGTYTPVGSQNPRQSNARIVCSTSMNIDLAVRERTFREDLYYRLAGCAVYIPPLRERREDIAPLVEHYIQRFNQTKGKSIFGVAPDAMNALLQHTWPHNLRELENLIDRIVVLKNSGSVEVNDLPPRLRNLVTDNIDTFFERMQMPAPQKAHGPAGGGLPTQQRSLNQNVGTQGQNNYRIPNQQNMSVSPTMGYMGQPRNPASYNPMYNPAGNFNQGMQSQFDDGTEIEQFIKKEIDLGSGIDFYRVVEEFENRLIAEALRRTNHNKNRAAQLLSMNRTTLVEKLKKRAASGNVKIEPGRVKRNPAFTIFDGLGNDSGEFDSLDFISTSGKESYSDLD